MFLQCTRCLHAYDAPSPSTACPRCGNVVGGAQPGPIGGGAPQTMAMDASAVADAIRSFQGGAQSPFAAQPPAGPPQPFAAPPAPPTPPTNHNPAAAQWQPPPAPAAPPQPGYASGGYAPPSFGPPPGYNAVAAAPSYGAPAYGAPFGQPQRDPALPGHAVVSAVLGAVAFLGGGCNLVGLAGIILGIRAYNNANNGDPEASGQARTARLVSIAGLVFTMLGWGAIVAFAVIGSR